MYSASSAARWLPRDFVETSQTGGLFTILAYVTMLVVFIFELKAFAQTDYATQMALDKQNDDLLQINFDIDLYDIECRNVKVSVFSQANEESLGLVAKDFWLRSIDSKGKTFGLAIKQEEEEDEDTAHEKRMAQLQKEDGKEELDHDWLSSHDGFKHKSFEHVLEAHDFTLINFFAEWCSHCRNFSPKWAEIAKKVNRDAYNPGQTFPDRDGKNRGVQMLKMNCVDFKDLCHTQGIDAYPTLRLYKADGTFSVYEGKRDETELIRWIERTVKMKSYGWAKDHEAFERGCNAKGRFQVSRVPGHFELQAGGGDQTLNPKMTNVSLLVKHLSFSDPDDGKYHRQSWAGMPHNVLDHLSPVDGRNFVTANFHEAWVHDLKVVSTVSTRGATAYQFSHQHRLSKVPEADIPQAQFHYDIEPFSLVMRVDSKKWYEFITSMLAIVGGTFVVMRLMSTLSLTVVGTFVKSVVGGKHPLSTLDTGHLH